MSMQRLTRWLLSVGAALALAAPAALFAQAKMPGQPEKAAPGAPGAIQPAEQMFLRHLHRLNQDEIQAGNLALKKAAVPEVREFAQMMVKDHTQADKDLQTLAHKLNFSLEPTGAGQYWETVGQTTSKKYMEKLQGLSEPQFDAFYMATQPIDHMEAISVAERAKALSKNADLNSYFDKVQPTLQGHLKHAEDLLGNFRWSKEAVKPSSM